MNPLGLVATLVYTYAALQLTLHGEIEIAAASFFVGICAIGRQRQITQIMAIYYVVLAIRAIQEKQVFSPSRGIVVVYV